MAGSVCGPVLVMVAKTRPGPRIVLAVHRPPASAHIPQHPAVACAKSVAKNAKSLTSHVPSSALTTVR